MSTVFVAIPAAPTSTPAASATAPATPAAVPNAVPAAARGLEPRWVRGALLAVALGFLALFLFAPLAAVWAEAFRKGWDTYRDAISDDDALAAIRLTLLTAAIAVPLNVVFGVAASWCIAKFNFRGKSLLLTLIDLPFSVSPVI